MISKELRAWLDITTYHTQTVKTLSASSQAKKFGLLVWTFDGLQCCHTHFKKNAFLLNFFSSIYLNSGEMQKNTTWSFSFHKMQF